MPSIQNNIRNVLGISKDSWTWQNLLKDFREWHRDPAYPERKHLTRTSEGFPAELASYIPYIASRYLTAANTELDPAGAIWPDDVEVITEQLYQLAAYEGSENRRQNYDSQSRHHLNHPVPPQNQLQAPQGAPLGDATSSPATSSHTMWPAPEGALLGDATSSPGTISLAPQLHQALLTWSRIAHTTLIVSISTESSVKLVPLNQCFGPRGLAQMILNPWSMWPFYWGEIDHFSVRYPWLSPQPIESDLGEAAYADMIEKVVECPCWQTEPATCYIEVNIMMKMEDA